jgi:hypothetical protein
MVYFFGELPVDEGLGRLQSQTALGDSGAATARLKGSDHGFTKLLRMA